MTRIVYHSVFVRHVLSVLHSYNLLYIETDITLETDLQSLPCIGDRLLELFGFSLPVCLSLLDDLEDACAFRNWK